MSINRVILIGNLGADPEVHQFQNGGMVANVSIATTEKWNDRQTGERKEHTEWHRVVFSNRLAEVVQQYLRKGSQIYVEGKIATRKWQDQNGQDRYSTEIRANNMQMLGGQNGVNPPNNNQEYQQQAGQFVTQNQQNMSSNGFSGSNTSNNPTDPAMSPDAVDDEIPF